jgi:hypothetical protein
MNNDINEYTGLIAFIGVFAIVSSAYTVAVIIAFLG